MLPTLVTTHRLATHHRHHHMDSRTYNTTTPKERTAKAKHTWATQHNTDLPLPCTTCYKPHSGACRREYLRNHPCTICGKDGHTKFNCQIIEPQSITCSTCQRTGHLPAACRNGAPLPKPGQQQSPKSQQPPQQQLPPSHNKGSTPLTWACPICKTGHYDQSTKCNKDTPMVANASE